MKTFKIDFRNQTQENLIETRCVKANNENSAKEIFKKEGYFNSPESKEKSFPKEILKVYEYRFFN